MLHELSDQPCVYGSGAFPYPQDDSSVCVYVCVWWLICLIWIFQLVPSATILFVVFLLLLNYCKPLEYSVMTWAWQVKKLKLSVPSFPVFELFLNHSQTRHFIAPHRICWDNDHSTEKSSSLVAEWDFNYKGNIFRCLRLTACLKYCQYSIKRGFGDFIWKLI